MPHRRSPIGQRPRCRWISMPSSSAPASRAFINSTDCGNSASRGGFEAGTGVGGTWYLEPLPGRAVRFRKLDLRLLVLAGPARRMGLGGAFRWPARDRALPEPRRRQVRSAPRHPVQDPRHRRALPREHAQLGHHPGRRPALHGPLPGHRGWRAVGGDVAEAFPGSRAFRARRSRRDYWPKEPVSFAGKRVAVIGTGATGIQTMTEVAKSGRAPDGVPAHAAMGRHRCTTPDRRRRK